MLIKLEQQPSLTEIEVLIKYAQPCAEVDKLAALLQSADMRIKCDSEHGETLVTASDIYYFESVDKRTFVYLERDVYRTEAPLYRLAGELEALGFVQVNKACILNIVMLKSVKPLLNSRMEATLKNGERLCITRKYLDNVKHALQKEARI
jgi:DNA-binding LytR/AlgR family response regulator